MGENGEACESQIIQEGEDEENEFISPNNVVLEESNEDGTVSNDNFNAVPQQNTQPTHEEVEEGVEDSFQNPFHFEQQQFNNYKREGNNHGQGSPRKQTK